MSQVIETEHLQPDGTEMSLGTSHGVQRPHELHLNLINFLFSLSIGRVAIEVSRILHNANANWLKQEYWPSYTHLAVGSLIIILSWLGWRKSPYAARTENAVSVFSRSFVELSIDLALVVLYFRLVSCAERAEFGICQLANASDEAWIVAGIFTLYFCWDLVTKWPAARRGVAGDQRGFWSRTQVSLLAMMLGWFAVLVAQCVSASPLAVCSFDAAIMGLAVFFREGKEYVSKQSGDCLLLIPVVWFFCALFLAIYIR